MATDIDRIAPTRRPAGRAAMKQRWAELLFLHWEVDPDAIRRHLPPGLTLDTFEGRAFVGLVPFTMTGVRPIWAPPFPPVSNFHEVNVRTYVHREGRDPGVWFFSLDAASSVAVRIARAAWRLPYHRARMSLEFEGERIAYRSERLWPGPTPAEVRVRYAPEGAPLAATPGTLEHFLAERYVLYARGREEKLFLGRVHHTPYPLQRARAELEHESLIAAAGIPRGSEAPMAHFAREVTVDVFALEALPPT